MEISVVDCVREVIASEAESLGKVAAGLDGTVAGFVYEIDRCFGNIYLVGVGKSGDVAHKIASTLDSIGVPAFSFSPLDLCHGCMGAISVDDLVIAISNSGETEELLYCVNRISEKGVRVISVVGRSGSRLEGLSALCVSLPCREDGLFGVLPSTSTVVMAAFGDGVVAALAKLRGLELDEFLKNHPSGQIGRSYHG